MVYKQIKQNFDRGLWSAEMVKLCVTKGLITSEECDAILAGAERPSSDGAEEILKILEG